MKTGIRWIGATVILVAVSGASLWHAHDSIVAVRSRVTAAESRRIRARAAIHDASDRRRAARQASVALKTAVPAGGEKRPDHAQRAARDWNGEAKAFEAQVKDPKAQLARLAVAKLHLREKFGPFYRKIGLTPDKMAALEDIEATYDERNQDIYYAAVAQHLDNDDPAVKELYGEAARERIAAEKKVLGREGRAELAEYQRTLPIQDFVAGFDGLATVSGEPLNEAQKQQLVTAIVQTIPDFKANKSAPANLMGVDWSQVDAAAAAILSPRQFELLQTQDPPTYSAGGGGRFWSALNKSLSDAKKADTNAATVAATTKPGS